MATTLARKGAHGSGYSKVPWRVAAIVAMIGVVAIAIAAFALLGPQAPTVPARGGTLNAHQLVIQSEIQDRYGPSGLTPQQVVIRGEIRDRNTPAAHELTAQQLVIRSEVADRYRDR